MTGFNKRRVNLFACLFTNYSTLEFCALFGAEAEGKGYQISQPLEQRCSNEVFRCRLGSTRLRSSDPFLQWSRLARPADHLLPIRHGELYDLRERLSRSAIP